MGTTSPGTDVLHEMPSFPPSKYFLMIGWGRQGLSAGNAFWGAHDLAPTVDYTGFFSCFQNYNIKIWVDLEVPPLRMCFRWLEQSGLMSFRTTRCQRANGHVSFETQILLFPNWAPWTICHWKISPHSWHPFLYVRKIGTAIGSGYVSYTNPWFLFSMRPWASQRVYCQFGCQIHNPRVMSASVIAI